MLIEDVPGVRQCSPRRWRSIDCSVSRIQFKPDLLPSDITGISAYVQETREFEFKPARCLPASWSATRSTASAKTQSTLLPEAVARLREQSTRSAPQPQRRAARRSLALTGAFAAGVGLATLARKRLRVATTSLRPFTFALAPVDLRLRRVAALGPTEPPQSS